jgi:hypothetical protein
MLDSSLEANSDLSPFNGQNPRLMVWMRTSAIPTVDKVYGICRDCDIPAGDCEIEIPSRFPADWLEGEKWIVVTGGEIGAGNLYLGVVFAIALVATLACAILLLVSHLRGHARGSTAVGAE